EVAERVLAVCFLNVLYVLAESFTKPYHHPTYTFVGHVLVTSAGVDSQSDRLEETKPDIQDGLQPRFLGELFVDGFKRNGRGFRVFVLWERNVHCLARSRERRSRQH